MRPQIILLSRVKSQYSRVYHTKKSDYDHASQGNN